MPQVRYHLFLEDISDIIFKEGERPILLIEHVMCILVNIYPQLTIICGTVFK